MRQNHADPSAFRDLVVKLVKEGHWAGIDGEPKAALARRLGVTVDVLKQAESELEDEAKQRGAKPRQLGTRAGFKRDYANLAITMPPEVHEPWLHFCKSFRVKPAQMLRSLIHHFLKSGSRPKTLGGTWHFKNAYYSIAPDGRLHAKARVTREVQIALDHYAKIWNVKVTGIIRGLIAETLDRGTTPNGMLFVSCSALWSAEKYLASANSS